MYSEFFITKEDSRASALAGCCPSGYALHLEDVAGSSKICTSSTSAGKAPIFTLTSCSTSSQTAPTPITSAPLFPSPQTIQSSPPPAASVILQHRNPSNWTSATPLTRPPSTVDTSLSNPQVTPPINAGPQNLNTTSSSRRTTCISSQPHNYNATSTSFTTIAPLSTYASSTPSTSPPCNLKSPTIGITAGVLLGVVGLSCIFGMLFLLLARRRVLKIVEKGKDAERVAGKRDKEVSGRGEVEGPCCEWRRFEMEGVGRPSEMEPGLDHGALMRHEMSAG
ncbi:hypothetical protein ACMFMG_003016 [Clarireedia jacksonii]